jgi:Methyltransferase domain
MPFNLADHPLAFEYPIQPSGRSAWITHMPLAPILVKLLRPRTLVELGTHIGDSYMSFCSAVNLLATDTQCTAVDTWKGDAHTKAYGPEVLEDLRKRHDPHFSGFSRLLQSTFDDAAPAFSDGGIDLLHIDGAHTYEAVRHDYETWLPKLSRRGVVLFHDTCQKIEDFGVWKLWEEISPARPSANLPYGCGLGILAIGPEQPADFLDFLREINTRPGLVDSLKALGDHMVIFYNYTLAVQCLHQCQHLANHWRKNTGQPILTPTPNINLAMTGPAVFGAGVVRDVQQLATDALNLVAEMMANREQGQAPKAP